MRILHLFAPKAALAAVLFLGVALAAPATCLAQEGGKMKDGKMADDRMMKKDGKMMKKGDKMSKDKMDHSKMDHDKMGKM